MQEVWERHGVVIGVDRTVSVYEGEAAVKIAVKEGVDTRTVSLTPDEARYLASKLRRLASRVEWRVEVAK